MQSPSPPVGRSYNHSTGSHSVSRGLGLGGPAACASSPSGRMIANTLHAPSRWLAEQWTIAPMACDNVTEWQEGGRELHVAQMGKGDLSEGRLRVSPLRGEITARVISNVRAAAFLRYYYCRIQYRLLVVSYANCETLPCARC